MHLYPTREQAQEKPLLIPFAAKTPAILAGIAQAAKEWLEEHRAADAWRDLAYTLVRDAAQQPLPCRLVIVADSNESTRAALDAFLGGHEDTGLFVSNVVGAASPAEVIPPRVAFIVGGTGAQWIGMAPALMAQEPVFRRAIEQCAELFAHHADWSLIDELLAEQERSRLGELEIGAVATFSVCVGLERLLRSWGIAPDGIAGHSMGEIVGAHLAGGLTLEDAVRVIFHWSRIQEQVITPGQMMAVGMSAENARELLASYEGRISLAAINSPQSITLSGDPAALREIQDILEAREIFNRLLQTGGAFHSYQMDPLEQPLLERIAGITPRTASIPFYSTVRLPARGAPTFDTAHWWQNLRQTVQLRAAIDQMRADGYNLFWELGPHPTMSGAIAECLAECVEAQGRSGIILGTLRRREDTLTSLLHAAGAFYVRGGTLDWERLYAGQARRLVSLPEIRPRALARRDVDEQARRIDSATFSSADESLRTSLILEYLLVTGTQVMKISKPRLSPDLSWIELGLDSLQATQIRSLLESELGVTVPLTRFLDGKSLTAFAEHLASQIALLPDSTQADATLEADSDDIDALVERMSASDVRDLLGSLMTQVAAEDLQALLIGIEGES